MPIRSRPVPPEKNMIQLELLLPDASPDNVVIRLEVFRAFKRDESPPKTPDWYLSIARRLRPYLKGPYDSKEILQLIHSFTQRNRIKECAAREVLAAGEHEAWEYKRDDAGKLAWRVIDDGPGTSQVRSFSGAGRVAKTG